MMIPLRFVLMFSLLAMNTLHAQSQTSTSGCGGTSQPRCQVYAPADDYTTDTAEAYSDNVTAWNNYSKAFANVASNTFTWSFVPQIPTAACVNPMIVSPIHGAPVEMDTCGPFNTFSTFINGVLAFFCLLGCVQQIKEALSAN